MKKSRKLHRKERIFPVVVLKLDWSSTVPSLDVLFQGLNCNVIHTAQEMKFFIKDFFGKCDQICRKLWSWSHLLKKYLIENFIFCAVRREVQLVMSNQSNSLRCYLYLMTKSMQKSKISLDSFQRN